MLGIDHGFQIAQTYRRLRASRRIRRSGRQKGFGHPKERRVYTDLRKGILV